MSAVARKVQTAESLALTGTENIWSLATWNSGALVRLFPFLFVLTKAQRWLFSKLLSWCPPAVLMSIWSTCSPHSMHILHNPCSGFFQEKTILFPKQSLCRHTLERQVICFIKIPFSAAKLLILATSVFPFQYHKKYLWLSPLGLSKWLGKLRKTDLNIFFPQSYFSCYNSTWPIVLNHNSSSTLFYAILT